VAKARGHAEKRTVAGEKWVGSAAEAVQRKKEKKLNGAQRGV
jgi:hypothetical protein